jgi:hypothetical protein
MVTVEQKIEKIKKERKEARTRGLKYVIVTALIALIAQFVIPWGWFFFVPTVLFVIVFLCVIYWIWSPVALIGYKIRETYCYLIMEGGAYKRADLQLTGFTLTEKGWVVPKNEEDGIGILSKFGIDPGERIKKPHSWFGLRFFNFPYIFEEPYVETFKVDKYDPSTEEIVSRENVIYDGFFVVPYNYGQEIKDIYTKNGYPISFNMGLLGELLNVPLAKFGTNNWYDAFIKEFRGAVFEIIDSSEDKELRDDAKELAAFFYQKFEERGLIKKCLIEYGIYIKAIQIGKLVRPKDIVDAADEERTEELLRKAANVKASADSDVLVAKASAIDLLFLKRSGLTNEEYQQALREPKIFKKKYGFLRNLCQKEILDTSAIAKGTGIRFSSENGGGGIVDAAALYSGLSNKTLIPKTDGVDENVGEKKGKIFDSKTRESLKKAGLPVHLEDEV